jgi:hypothetical protein
LRPGTFEFRGEWQQKVKALPETGMGYCVVSIALRDGRKFEQVVIDSGWLSRVRGLADVPFCEEDIAAIAPSHETWEWEETP